MWDPLGVVQLRPLMARSEGRPDVVIGLIDGPVMRDHPDLSEARIREVPGSGGASCARKESVACTHGTFVAAILVARRGSAAAAICPGCTLLVRPIFTERPNGNDQMPSADPETLAHALAGSVDAGARVINLSAALVHSPSKGVRELERALDYSARRGVIVVAAAGNQADVGSTAITRHTWVIPVVGCGLEGKPTKESNLGRSIGRRGLSAPGENITSLGTNGEPQTFGGTSAAAPFVTGAIALLWSEFPAATAGEVKLAVTQPGGRARTRLVPPLLNAWAAYHVMASMGSRRR